MDAVALACAAQAVYVIGFVFFKAAATQMLPLTGRRPFQVVRQVVTSPRWLLGMTLLMAGSAMASVALTELPLVMSLPPFGFSLAFLLVAGFALFGERVTAREWPPIVMVAVALVILALTVGLPSAPERVTAPGIDVPGWKIAAVVVPSLLIPMWMFSARDRAVDGRHARPLTGVAYGLGAGVLLGTTEVFGVGLAQAVKDEGTGVLATAHPYIFVIAGVLGLGLVQVGLQRCRLIVLITVVTVTAKAHLILAGTLLYARPWPADRGTLLMQIAGIALAFAAVPAFPRYERKPRRVDSEPEPDPAAELLERSSYTGTHRRLPNGQWRGSVPSR